MCVDADCGFGAVVNPDRESGKVTLITRYGAGKVSTENCTLNNLLTWIRWRSIFQDIYVQYRP